MTNDDSADSLTSMDPSFPPVSRTLDPASLLAKKSHFLFGPRQTGKASLIRDRLGATPHFDLLDTQTWLELSHDPSLLGKRIPKGQSEVVIDEIQRLPELLNEVHRLIEDRKIRFLLTGSSARKLRRGGVNLLGGRARTKTLHPFTAFELGKSFDLDKALRYGALPPVWFSDDPTADLLAYIGTYLNEEIRAGGAVRNVPAFSRFLKIAALCSGTIVNFTAVASDAQVPRTTIHEYWSILIDTLLMHELPAWRSSVKRKPIVTSKHYLFDVGLVNAILGRTPSPGTPEYGAAFEAWVFHELLAWRDYRSTEPLSFWRSTSGYEVDFLIGDHTAIEVKAKSTVGSADLRSLRAIADEKRFQHRLCVCLASRRRDEDGITILQFSQFVRGLYDGEFGGA